MLMGVRGMSVESAVQSSFVIGVRSYVRGWMCEQAEKL